MPFQMYGLVVCVCVVCVCVCDCVCVCVCQNACRFGFMVSWCVSVVGSGGFCSKSSEIGRTIQTLWRAIPRILLHFFIHIPNMHETYQKKYRILPIFCRQNPPDPSLWGGGGGYLCVRVCVRARARVCVCVCESVALTISRFLLMKLHVHVCVICRRLQCRGDCLLCVPLCLACIINYYLSVLVFALHTYTPAHKQTHTHTHTRTHAYV